MRFVDSPRERLRDVTLGLAAHKSLPNIVLGAFLTALIQLAVGLVPWEFAAATGGVWAISVVVYAWADAVRAYLEEQKNRVLDPLDDRPRGVE